MVNILNLNESSTHELLEKTEKILRAGGVAIVPTDTVYGLVCDGRDDAAKDRIFQMKGRSASKPLIGFADTIEKVQRFAEVPPEKMPFLKENWPGAVTFILKAKVKLPRMTTEKGTIAFRIPDHRFFFSLMEKFEILASTSANISGEKAPCRIEEISDGLKDKADIVIDGGIVPGTPSSILDLTGKEHIRLR